MRTLFLAAVFSLAALTSSAQAQEPRTHVVQRGETLELIASNYGVSESAILEANPMAKEMFFIGMKLTIPVLTSTAVTRGTPQIVSAAGRSEETASHKEKVAESDYQTGLSMGGISASYYFPLFPGKERAFS